MSIQDLFPDPSAFILGLSRATEQPTGLNLSACRRCGAIAFDQDTHYRWHQAVDTGATTALPTPKDPR